MAPPEATEEWVQRIDTHAPTGDVNGRQELTPLAGVYGVEFSSRVKGMGIGEVKTAPRSPWQNPYVERLIGTSIRPADRSMLPRQTE